MAFKVNYSDNIKGDIGNVICFNRYYIMQKIIINIVRLVITCYQLVIHLFDDYNIIMVFTNRYV